MNYPDIEPRIFEEWQETINLVAKLCHVPSALLMRRNSDTMEVMSASQNQPSSYKAFETAPLNNELYCETVINTQLPLHVPNALKDPDWDHNPDIALGMIFYYGIPVNWPNGEPFGTLCILDKKERCATEQEQGLMKRFSHILEMTLELTISKHELETKNSELSSAMQSIKTVNGMIPLCAWCYHSICDHKGSWVSLEEYFEEYTDAQITHGICPSCQDSLKEKI